MCETPTPQLVSTDMNVIILCWLNNWTPSPREVSLKEFLEVPGLFKHTDEIPWENIGAFKLIRKFQKFFLYNVYISLYVDLAFQIQNLRLIKSQSKFLGLGTSTLINYFVSKVSEIPQKHACIQCVKILKIFHIVQFDAISYTIANVITFISLTVLPVETFVRAFMNIQHFRL